MESLLKTAAVLIVLIVGIGAALFFRKQSPPAANENKPVASKPVGLKEPPAKPEKAPAASKAQGVPLPAQVVEPTPAAEPTIEPLVPEPIHIDPRPDPRPQIPPRSIAVDPSLVDPPPLEKIGRRDPPVLPPKFEPNHRPPLPNLSNLDMQRSRQDAGQWRHRAAVPAQPSVVVKPEPPRVVQKQPASPPDRPVIAAPPQEMRYHTIVDGDTLPRIARRYLGDANRLQEIFNLNRDVLRYPDILPLGRKLQIPPARPAVNAMPVSDSGSPAAVVTPAIRARPAAPYAKEFRMPRLVPLPDGALSN